MKKRRLFILAGLSALAVGISIFAFKPSLKEEYKHEGNVLNPHMVLAEGSATTSKIAGHNLSLENSIEIVYYVSNTNVVSGDEVGLLIWNTYQTNYVYGTQDYALTDHTKETISSIDYDTYYFDGVSAKQMADYFYAVSYIKHDGVYTYSKPDKYSVLTYCHHYKDSTAEVRTGGTVLLGELCLEILNYGGTSQKAFNYNTGRLANVAYYTVTIVDGYLLDGFTTGLFNSTETVKFKIDSSVEEPFLSWKDQDGYTVDTDTTGMITGITSNRTITAKYAVTSVGLRYEIDYDHATLIGIGDCSDSDIIVPATYKGLPITAIKADAFSLSSIESIFLSANIKTIGSSAFYGCTKLKKVTFKDGLETISSNAFKSCGSLDDIDLPNTVKTIGDNAFDSCTSLDNVTLPNEIDYLGIDCFKGCNSLGYEHTSGNCCYIPSHNNDYMLLYKLSDTSKTTYAIHADTKIIYNGVFSGCSSLTNITVPNKVERIGKDAFKDCTALTTLNLPDSLTSYVDCVSGCTSLSYYTNDDVKYLGNSTNNYVVCIKANVLNKTSYTIANTTRCIEKEAFSGCSAMTTVEIPTSVVFIGEKAFSGCSALTSLTTPLAVPSNCTRFYQFFGTENSSVPSALKTIVITAGDDICDHAFDSLTNITSVTLPDTIVSIGDYAFNSCTGITSFIIHEGVKTIGECAFSECKEMSNFRVPCSLEILGDGAFDTSDDNKMIAASRTIKDHVYYYGNDVNRYVIAFYADYKNPSWVELNANCKCIANGVFTSLYYNGSNPKYYSFVIPDSVTSIGSSAFGSSSTMTNIVIPKNVKHIGKNIFYSSNALTSVTVHPDNTTYDSRNNCNGIVETATNTLIAGCPATKLVEGIEHIGKFAFRDVNIGNLTFPKSLLSIGAYAFNPAGGVNTIYFENNLVYIGEYAFSGCYSVNTVTYNGTTEQWNAVHKGLSWNNGFSGLTVNCVG